MNERKVLQIGDILLSYDKTYWNGAVQHAKDFNLVKYPDLLTDEVIHQLQSDSNYLLAIQIVGYAHTTREPGNLSRDIIQAGRWYAEGESSKSYRGAKVLLDKYTVHGQRDWNYTFPNVLNEILEVMHRYKSDNFVTRAQQAAVVNEKEFTLYDLPVKDAWIWFYKNRYTPIGSLTDIELLRSLPYQQRQAQMKNLLVRLQRLCL